MLQWKTVIFFPINKRQEVLPSDQLPASKSDGLKLTTVTKYSVQMLSVQELA